MSSAVDAISRSFELRRTCSCKASIKSRVRVTHTCGGKSWLHTDAEEHCSHPPPPQPGDIRLVVGVLFSKLVTFVNNAVGGINMGVDNKQIVEQVLKALRRTGRREQSAPEEELNQKRREDHGGHLITDGG